MPVFVELTTDAFEENFRRQRAGKRGDGTRSSRAGRRVARRPTRGIEIKEDTYAIIKVVAADGREIPLVDSSSPDGFTSSGYANFILQTVQEARMEKHQIVETFGDAYIFFFGENPRFLDVSAVLVNSHDFNWEAEWWENYNTYFRGTKLVELGARCYLFYDDNIVEGYMLTSQAVKSADQPYTVNLSFRLFITNYSNISLIGDPEFPVRSSVFLPDGVELTNNDAQQGLISAFRGESLGQAQLENFDKQGRTVLNNGFASGRRISDLIRSAPASFAFSPDVYTELSRTTDFNELMQKEALIMRTDKPIRGLIAENVDEFVGVGDGRTNFGFDTGENRPPSAIDQQIRDQLESQDLFQDAIQFLTCFGANMNNPDAVIKIGLGPNFAPRATIQDAATFNPLTGQREKKDLVSTIQSDFAAFAKDPLGSVFGKPPGGSEFGPNRSKYTEGAGDTFYGYPSDFDSGPGFGKAGFGEMGGFGFGSGAGATGDPGFKDPRRFTFAGVSDNRSAFDRFLKPRNDTSRLGVGGGLALSTSGLSGGAVVAVGGKPSAFSLISVPGTLDPEGKARASADAIAQLQARQKFGFSLANPFGVSCPAPTAVGFNFSLP